MHVENEPDGLPALADRETKPVGIAVVGAGYWGPNLARNSVQSPVTRLAAVCDMDLTRAVKLAGALGSVNATDDLQEVLDDPEVEAIAVATPAATHLEVAMAAIEAGKHVLVEKPLASSYAEGRALVNAADERGVVLMCDHTYCYTPAVQRIRELVHTGVLGDLQFVDSVRINLGLVQRDIDVLWDLAPHDLSILDYILPDGCMPIAVAAHGADPIGAGQACVAYLTLQLPGGAIAHVNVNWLSPIKVRTTTIGGSNRTLVWDDLNPSQRISVYDRGVDLADPSELDPDDRRQAIVSYRSGDMVAPALPEREALQGVMAEFADCIRTGRASRTDGRAGLRVLDVLEAASRSLEFHGSVVPLRCDR
ncbi:MAG TPA: Gfo/Idh/MocA family oxidoreductase [Solirubrobacteraceae bacterium]|jgi:predicted dehydrogenase|nr:Gfo/Idh/MocA family oxidoreductase [Solirubrobacteraceae bacterium]